MESLFDNDKPRGYRLFSFEFYNWGSFHDHIWKVDPKGESTLLTGGNGSGKTTLVDALITLLVPQNMRHYNQSSGAERKKERTEQSYMLGVVGNLKEEQQSLAQQKTLRTQKDYSILLGVFFNAVLNKYVTLGQVRYFTNGSLQRQFFTSDRYLEIKENILPLEENKGSFKKRLTTQWGIRFYENFRKYQTAFIRSLGMRSEKALNLFSQTVGVKVLGDLNGFIRSHMLEPSDTENLFNNLYSNYQTLLNTHRKIEQAEKQLELLEPVIKEGKEVIKLQRNEKEAELLKAYLPLGFLPLKNESLDKEEITITEKVEVLEQQSLRAAEEKRFLEEQQYQIRQELEGNQVSHQISLLKEKMKNTEFEREIRRKRHQEYEQLSRDLELPLVQSLQSFQSNQKLLKEIEESLREQLEKNRDDDFIYQNTLKDLEKNRDDLEQEILSLGNRKNNIPMNQIELRRSICEALKLQEEELSYAGELIRVREDQVSWRPAAEKLLHNFALCLLVPDEHYSKVNRYINEHNLKSRLVYYRVNQEETLEDSALWNQEEDILPLKLEVKQDNALQGWVWNYLNRNFDYHCVEQVDQLPRYKRALTLLGLIKRANRHEKDDRRHVTGPENYVLGWNNLEKRKKLQQQLIEVSKDCEETFNTLTALKQKGKKFEDQRRRRDQLASINEFGEIDWFHLDSRLRQLKEEYNRLCDTHKDVKKLEDKLEQLIIKIEQLVDENNTIQQEKGKLLDQMEQVKRYRNQFHEKIDDPYTFKELLTEDELLQLKDTFQKQLPKNLPEYLEELLRLEERIQIKIERQRDEISQNLRQATSTLVRSMYEFINPKVGVLEQFPSWVGETAHLKAEEEYISSFDQFYKRLKEEGLPQYKKDFRKYLNDRMQEDLIGFQESLDRKVRLIQRNIEVLNKSLRKLKYNTDPDSYIRLIWVETKDVAIREFQRDLRNARGDAARLALGDEAELENCFLRMQKLITRLKQEDLYRQKVLDLRYWLEFAAEEKDCITDEQIQFYEDSNSLSGGEKAKWAYTILASAIAYQFGINENGDRSFRFVVVDEAFSKVDPENSTYAMNLFKSLSLQLMVVTPLDKINLVEDYIETVHYVENRDKKSRLYKLGFQEYEEKKKEWQKQEV
ncbi:MAG: hypothetical protein JEY99_07245 [Spirochaetales bacterium]|nr:hypothetical protein [Spirochaetales bacterium]